MNKKVLKTMIALVVVFLVALYVLKIFFPEQFVMAIELPALIAIGDYIDSHIWATMLVSSITTFIGYWFYFCAVSRKWFLNWKEILVVLAVIVVTRLLYFYDLELSSAVNVLAMLLIPLMSGAKLRDVSITYSVHYVSQLLSLKIRTLPMYLSHINSIISILLTIEGLFWLLLFYFCLNYKKEI